jgi:hypothetical protein
MRNDFMQCTFIQFASQADRVRGFYELATRARIDSLPGEVYRVRVDALPLLDEKGIRCQRISHPEAKAMGQPDPSALSRTTLHGR